MWMWECMNETNEWWCLEGDSDRIRWWMIDQIDDIQTCTSNVRAPKNWSNNDPANVVRSSVDNAWSSPHRLNTWYKLVRYCVCLTNALCSLCPLSGICSWITANNLLQSRVRGCTGSLTARIIASLTPPSLVSATVDGLDFSCSAAKAWAWRLASEPSGLTWSSSLSRRAAGGALEVYQTHVQTHIWYRTHHGWCVLVERGQGAWVWLGL